MADPKKPSTKAHVKDPIVSVVAAAGARVGCLEGAPDLATDPKHMKAYGQHSR